MADTPRGVSEAPQADWSKTVNLPKTDFPMKADLPKREPGLLKLWADAKVYERLLDKNKAAPKAVLHDGPPYANGHIHIGHALNKILKDVVVKVHAMSGRFSPYVPGWDCHGLPIEQALLKELGLDKRQVTDIPAFRKQAEDFARKFIGIQREEFKRLGVMGAWEEPYTTMTPEYEAAVLRAFRVLLSGGYIYRGRKPVYWCSHDETALAEAEVEYKDKTSPSVYVSFPVKAFPPHAGFPWKLRHREPCFVLSWTTTPWTLPANVALAFHPEFEYVRVKLGPQHPEGVYIVAKKRLSALLDELGAREGHSVLEEPPVLGRALEGLVAETPFDGRESKGVLADYVTAEDGTGVVHTAPGHGREDYETGRKYKLPILSPVDPGGKFTAEAPAFQGQFIFKANAAIIEALRQSGRLLKAGEVAHSYPHCWRCKNPVIFRATEQWFLSVDHQGLRERLQGAIDKVKWVPEVGKARISAMVQGRPDWCISRQRFWGTPIPVLYCASCSSAAASGEVLKAIEDRVAAQGSDFWFEEMGRPVAPKASGDALAWDFLPKDMACRDCGGRTFRRELDILDVWVDSGASWLAVLKGLDAYPCELYLEGSDQHRGWFQSSLVLSVALEGTPPYREVLTHGFVLDDQGRAMHKSLGNVVSPQTVVDQYGADILRLWVSLADYSDDVRLSSKLLEGPIDTYRKVRNTFRYLLGNTFDFDPRRDAVPYAELPELDRFALHRLSELIHEVEEDYRAYRFRAAAKAVTEYCINDLSSFYLDVLKDRLYCEKPKSLERRAGQTVLWEILHALTRLMAPILSFTAEETWQNLRRSLKERGAGLELEDSVFLAGFPAVHEEWFKPELDQKWIPILEAREHIHIHLEAFRREGKIGSALGAKVRLKVSRPDPKAESGEFLELLALAANVSKVEILKVEAGPEREYEIRPADGRKCPRCWRWREDTGRDHPELCARCAKAVA